MYDPNNVPVSYRKLFEYASELYPLAISELRVAFWHANELVRVAKKLATAADIPLTSVIPRMEELSLWETLATEEQKDARGMQGEFMNSVRIVRDRIRRADADIERIKDNPNENGDIPEILQRKAVIGMRMLSIGDVSFDDPGPLLVQVMNIFATRGQKTEDGYTRYYYAQYLLDKDTKPTVEQLSGVLSPLYTEEYTQSSVQKFFANERANVLGVKSTLVRIAQAEPKFREHLQKLGWKDADF
jgi:hypothetical protein